MSIFLLITGAVNFPRRAALPSRGSACASSPLAARELPLAAAASSPMNTNLLFSGLAVGRHVATLAFGEHACRELRLSRTCQPITTSLGTAPSPWRHKQRRLPLDVPLFGTARSP